LKFQGSKVCRLEFIKAPACVWDRRYRPVLMEKPSHRVTVTSSEVMAGKWVPSNRLSSCHLPPSHYLSSRFKSLLKQVLKWTKSSSTIRSLQMQHRVFRIVPLEDMLATTSIWLLEAQSKVPASISSTFWYSFPALESKSFCLLGPHQIIRS
jgi:hypothetical protein